MEFKDLPDNLQEFVEGLKYGPYSIECDVIDALESAKNIDEFRSLVKGSMKEFIETARGIIDTVEG